MVTLHCGIITLATYNIIMNQKSVQYFLDLHFSSVVMCSVMSYVLLLVINSCEYTKSSLFSICKICCSFSFIRYTDKSNPSCRVLRSCSAVVKRMFSIVVEKVLPDWQTTALWLVTSDQIKVNAMQFKKIFQWNSRRYCAIIYWIHKIVTSSTLHCMLESTDVGTASSLQAH
jgi:hypothetical protein